MTTKVMLVSCVLSVIGLSGATHAGDTGEFEYLALYVVYSATDEDAQIIIEGGSDAPLRRVDVFGPEGLKPVRWKSGDKKDRKNRKGDDDLGFADFGFDTPEPTIEALMSAYPQGTYRFVGLTVDDERLVGEVDLSNDLLDAPQVITPQEGDTGIPVNGLIVFWNPVPGAEAIRLEIEDEETEVALKVDLPGDADRFEVPFNWLQSGTEEE